jgi:hypothetical protein
MASFNDTPLNTGTAIPMAVTAPARAHALASRCLRT